MKGNGMLYEFFSDTARYVMGVAHQEALRFRHEYIGTEHVLLGLLKERRGHAACCVLWPMLGEEDKLIRQVSDLLTPGPEGPMAENLPRCPSTTKALEHAIALGKEHRYVGTVHLLLGLLIAPEGVAAKVLAKNGVTTDKVMALLKESGLWGDSSKREDDCICMRIEASYKGVPSQAKADDKPTTKGDAPTFRSMNLKHVELSYASAPRYSFREKMNDYEREVTFATHAELLAYIASVDARPKGSVILPAVPETAIESISEDPEGYAPSRPEVDGVSPLTKAKTMIDVGTSLEGVGRPAGPDVQHFHPVYLDARPVTITNVEATDCPQGHHLKDGPCAADYCFCSCLLCRKECAERA